MAWGSHDPGIIALVRGDHVTIRSRDPKETMLIQKTGMIQFISWKWDLYDMESGRTDRDAHDQPAPFESRLANYAANPTPTELETQEAAMLRIRRCQMLGLPVANGFSTALSEGSTWYIDWERWSPDLPAEDIPAGTIDEPGRISHAAWGPGPRPRAWRANFDGKTVRALLSDEWL